MDLTTLYAHQQRKRQPQSQPQFSPPNAAAAAAAMSHTAFFYGTLMAPPVLHRVIWGSSTPPTPAHASLLRIRPAMLPAHQRHKVKHADYPAVLPAPASASVRGTLVEGLTDGDIWRLDIFEGEEYERRKVRVRVLQEGKEHSEGEGEKHGTSVVSRAEEEERNVEGEEVEAETYIWIAGARQLEAEEWDFAEFARDKMKRWVGREATETDSGFQGRPSIIEVDDAVAALQDPTGGRGANGSISRQLDRGGEPEDKVLESAV
ncbi:Nn.00g080920.m01.CDS01 [Neocucurbitaria sp. VM-36]